MYTKSKNKIVFWDPATWELKEGKNSRIFLYGESQVFCCDTYLRLVLNKPATTNVNNPYQFLSELNGIESIEHPFNKITQIDIKEIQSELSTKQKRYQLKKLEINLSLTYVAGFFTKRPSSKLVSYIYRGRLLRFLIWLRLMP